jgi:hypothetical protein
MQKTQRFVVSVVVLILMSFAIVSAQRSAATVMQFAPSENQFHLLANGIDVPSSGSTAYACGTTVACTATIGTVKIAWGTAPYTSASPSTLTMTALPFTSTTSYVCEASDATSAAHSAYDIINASASSTVITGPNTITDTMSIVCVGQ